MNKAHKWTGRTGLETLQGILSGEIDAPDVMGDTLNFKMAYVQKGVCVIEGTPLRSHLNPRLFVHGGWAMSILDSASLLSIISMLPDGKMSATSTFEMKFMRPLLPNVLYRAEGEYLFSGANLGHAQAKLFEVKTSKLVASCTCSASIFDTER